MAICVEGVYKKFCSDLQRSMRYGTADVLRDMAGLPAGRSELRKSEFWAVNNVSLELAKGEAVGIIGANGSGKSTLLRLLAGIFPPDKGRITIRGRVGALIAVGAGFHPHMTGRENIYLNGTLLGMTRPEIRSKFDRIADFADIGSFLDAPVSTYSNGMKVRLGFAIAIHSDVDILLADEILAVGDIQFKRKCYEKIRELRRNGVSIVFISHSFYNLQSVCSRGLLMHHGLGVYNGELHECIKRYLDLIDQENMNARPALKEAGSAAAAGAGNVTFSDVRVYQEGSDPDSTDVEFGKNFVIEFSYRFKSKSADPYQLRLGLKTFEGQEIQKLSFQEAPFAGEARYENEKLVRLETEGRFAVTIREPRIFPQAIRLDLGMKCMNIGVLEGGLYTAALFRIVEPKDKKMYFDYNHSSLTEFDYDIRPAACPNLI